MTSYYDIIIIGSGMSGLYSAYNIKNISPNTSFLILEKYKKDWIGGRTSNETFYGTEIVTGAGIGRKNKDKLLYNLLHKFKLKTPYFDIDPQYSQLFQPVNIKSIINLLKKEYKKSNKSNITFKEFSEKVLGKNLYEKFLISAGYTDYENEDVTETLYHYGMEDNSCCWKAFQVPWKKLVDKLYHSIGASHFKFSNKVIGIEKIQNEPCKFIVKTENNQNYFCNKIIIASTIDTIKKLLPYDIYNDIECQTFLRLYAKFDKKSADIMKKYVNGITFVPGPLQKIIPTDPDNGVYMISYSDNNNAKALKNNLENTKENRKLYETLLEKTLGITDNTLHIIELKNYYWPIGTHYYKPLNKKLYKNREEFIYKAQHPEKGILVVGEVVSRNQGWTEGALESVKTALTKDWIKKIC